MKKKIKIVKEKINAPFVEIKKEKTKIDEEETLDDKLSHEDQGFVDFSPTGRVDAPVLRADNSSQQTMESQLENVPARTNSQPDEGKMYSTADYSSNVKYDTTNQPKVEIKRFQGPSMPEQDFGLVQAPMRSAWTSNQPQQDVQKYNETIKPHVEEERRMPFRRGETRKRPIG